MDENRPARWLAIWPANIKRGRFEWELPALGAEQGEKFYHYGGLSYTFMSDRDLVLKEYGTMTINEWEDRGGDDQWYRDFPPLSSPPDEYSEEVESWISPEGEIYLCHHEQHETLAFRLCKYLGIKEVDSSLIRSGDLLDKRGWIKLYWNEIRLLTDCTQRQLDALFDIFLVLGRKGEAGLLRESLRRVLKIKPADDEEEKEKEKDSLRMTYQEFESLEADIGQFQKPWLGFALDGPDAIDKKEEPLDTAKAELLGVICDAVSKRRKPEPVPTQEPALKARREKPFVLTDQPYVEITVRAYCTMEELDDGHRRGISCFKTFCTEVEDDHGNQCGMIGGGIGYVTLSDRRRDGLDGEEFVVRHKDLWYAYQRALSERFGGEFPENEDQETEGR